MPEAETEVLDVPDEPQVTRMPDAEVERQQQRADANPPRAPEEHIPPDRSAFNEMRDKLDKAMADILKPPVATPSPTPPPAQPADKKPDPPATPLPTVKPDATVTPIDDDKTFTSAKAADWKKLKEAIKERETKLAEWQTKYAAKEKEVAEIATKLKLEDRTPEYTKQIEEWKSKHDRVTEQLEKVALERSERWNSQFAEPITDALTRAKTAVGTDKSELVEQLLSLAPSKYRNQQLNAIRDELEGVDQGQLDVAIATMDSTRAKRDAQLANHKQSFERLQGVQAEHAQRDAQLAQIRTNETIARVLAMAKNYDAFKPGDNDPEQALLAKTNEESVAKFFRMELPPEEIAVMPIVAAEGKRVIEKVLPALQKENAELREALKAHQTAKPAAAGGRQSPAAGADGAKPKSFLEAFQEHWPGQ